MDRYGDSTVVENDLEDAESKDITCIGIAGADHGYKDPVTGEKRYEDEAVASVIL